MRETNLLIQDFNTLCIKEEVESSQEYINLNITLEDETNDFTHKKSPFPNFIPYYFIPLSSNNLKIKIRLKVNSKIEKDLEYIFMDLQDLSKICGVITPIKYKLKIIQSLIWFDD